MRTTLSMLLTMLGVAALLICQATPSYAGLKLGKLFKMSKSQELSIAGEMQAEFAKDPGLITKGKEFDLVQQTGKRLVSKNGLKEYDYKFFLIKQDEVNAFATPGGYIYVTQGLLKYMTYDQALLAGVMAHELGHAKDRHVARAYEKMLQGALGLGALSIVLGDKNEDIIKLLGGVGAVTMLKYNRDQEEWADRSGVELSYKGGYDAYGLTRSLECLNVLYGSTDEAGSWLSNHPATTDRIKRTKNIAYAACGKKQGYVAIPKPSQDHPLYKLYGSGAAPEQQEQGGSTGSAEKYKRGDKKTSPVK